MLLKILLVLIGCLSSAVSFFVVRWMLDMEKKWEESQKANENAQKTIEQLTVRIDKLEADSVVRRRCDDTVNLFSQRVNRERHRINALEDLMRDGGLIKLVKNIQARQLDNDPSEE